MHSQVDPPVPTPSRRDEPSSRLLLGVSAGSRFRTMLIAGIVVIAVNALLAVLLFVHAFVIEPISELGEHAALLIIAALALCASIGSVIVLVRAVRASSDERMRAAAHVESERLFRERADESPIIQWITSATGDCLFTNKAWHAFTGRPFEMHLGHGWSKSIHPDDREVAFNETRVRISRREPIALQYRVRRFDGVYRWVMDIGQPQFNPHTGELEGYTGGCIDVTDRRRADEQLKELSGALQQAMDGIATVDASGSYTSVSDQYARIVGRPANELLGRPWSLMVFPPDVAKLEDAYEHMLREGRVERDARGVRGNGEVFHKRVAMIKRVDEAGAHVGHYCFMKDITAQKHAEASAAATERKQAALVSSAPVGIFHMRGDGTCTYVSPQWSAITGVDCESGLGMGWLACIHPEDRERAASQWQRAFDQRIDFRCETRIVRPDGTRWVIARATLVAGENDLVEFVGTLIDITDLKIAELELRSSMEELRLTLRREHALRQELDHRVRNNLAGLVGLLRAYESRGLSSKELARAMIGKIDALRDVHNLLAGDQSGHVMLGAIFSLLIERLVPAHQRAGVSASGPDAKLGPKQAAAFAMILQELVTNSSKHGALAHPHGTINVTWAVERGEGTTVLAFDWVEGPILSTASQTTHGSNGLGLSIVKGFAQADLRGHCAWGRRVGPQGTQLWVVEIEANVGDPGEYESMERSKREKFATLNA